ncbi:hypothetical protein [Verrucosispora sp. NA02020]|uniref:hypothetical protein n=1 Tax=Verrucosispora sp. NA02020 TaxID=2742132 RepID=UPI0015921DED|nr:hypothetical protein [Verrucosispora sp. NA02020]QKW12402.1 hypothetical protein HUT12_06060 [Verrucosispora sp. NA02020]
MADRKTQQPSASAGRELTRRQEKGVVGKHAPDGLHLARFGTFMLIARKFPQPETVMSRLKDALEADYRIAEVVSTEFESKRMGTRRIYRHDASQPSFLSGNEIKALQFSEPIVFKVQVPRKNQKPFRGHLDIPSDDYWVAWDGITMIVTWPHQKGESFPRSGGHIAIDILSDVANTAGFELYAQPCSPNCTNGFAHTTMVVHVCDEVTDANEYKKNGSFVDVHLHAPNEPNEIAKSIANDLRYEAEIFAEYKNQARRIREIEESARSMTEELLSLNILSIQRIHLPWWRRVVTWRDKRTQRRRASQLIALLWLSFAQIEASKRDWSELHRRLEDAVNRYETGSLFERDRLDDDGAIQSLDLSFIKAAVEQSAARQDTYDMASKTALGAAAALIGAIAGAIATTLAG